MAKGNWKKDGPLLTMRGQIDQNLNGHKLNIFDGLYTTGYVIEKFIIAGQDVTSTNELIAKLHTSKTTSSISNWNWNDVQEIAWAGWGLPNPGYVPQEVNFVDPENLVIENLYMSTYSTGESEQINYMIQLQKYSFPAWEGAGALVTNLSQGGPQ
jgi:hypothetical protein